jgi:hypothetical protein
MDSIDSLMLIMVIAEWAIMKKDNHMVNGVILMTKANSGKKRAYTTEILL